MDFGYAASLVASKVAHSGNGALAAFRKICDQGNVDDPPCEGGSPPPPRPPSLPQAISYTPFSESASINVSWRSSPSAQETYYELQRYSNGTWTTIYTGAQRSAGGGIYAEGIYAFRVRACNDGGCSDYLTDPQMRFSYGPSRSNNAVRKTDLETFLRTLGYETPASLGLGYDQLRQELTNNNCLDMNSSPTVTQNARTKDFKLSMVNSREELSTSLSLTQNLGISAKYGMFSGSYSSKKEMLSSSTRIEETTMLVASLRDQFSVQSISNPNLLSLSGSSVSMLQTGQGPKFRNFCGDGFVYSIAYGRQFYISFQLRSFNYSRDEIQSQTQSLKADISSYVSGGGSVGGSYDSTKKTQITQKYSGYNVQAYIVSTGSSVGVSGVVSLGDALQFMKDFEAEPISNGSYPIDFKTTDYTVPAGVSSYPAYAPYKTTLQRWYSFDKQLARRCEMFDETLFSDPALAMASEAKAVGIPGGSDLRGACFNMKRAVQENIQNCEDTTKWNSCIQPDSPYCVVPGASESCLAYASHLPYWTANTSSLALNADMGGALNSSSMNVSASTCLSGPQIRDQRVKSVDCSSDGGCPFPSDGVTVKTAQLYNASSGWNSWNSYNRCLYAQVTITNEGFWRAGAHVHQTQTVSGLIAQSLSYQF